MSSKNFPKNHQKWLQSVEKQLEYSQPGPCYGNQYEEDEALKVYLKVFLEKDLPGIGEEQKQAIFAELKQLGDNVLDYHKYAVESEKQPPTLRRFNAFGKRIDKINTSQGWKELNRASVKEKIIGQAYNSQYKEANRLVEFAKLYLFGGSAGLWVCPMAMTDGAACVLRKVLTDKKDHPFRADIRETYNRLVSLNPDDSWTSGQWMTEKNGGSDVSRSTKTVALEIQPSKYRLYGLKWFTSATESQVSIALARIVDPETQIPDQRLTCFLVKLHDEEGNLKKEIQILRLKDKLGTKPVPTAELLLKGVEAIQLSDRGRGIKLISEMLNITRIYNSTTSISYARRIVALNKDYACRRSVFGKKLSENNLHISVLSSQEAKLRGNMALVLQAATLFGKVEAGIASKPEKAALRILSPLAKLFTAKDCLQIISEGLEGFGGLGYLEDSNLPVYFRDAQVLPIWEGTTNVLCWDVVRAIKKLGEEGLSDFLMWMRVHLDECYRSLEPELRGDKEFGDCFRYLIIVHTETCNTMFNLVKGRSIKLRYEYNLRYAIFALAFVVVGVILLRFTHVGEDYGEEYFQKRNSMTAFCEWVRRPDFPSVEWFAKIQNFGEEELEARKALGLAGITNDTITDFRRPKF